MNTVTPTMTIEQVEKQIQTNTATYDRLKAAIEADKDLSPEGKLNKVASLREEYTEKHRDLKARHKDAVSAEQERLYRRAFQGGAGGIDSYRNVYSMAKAAPDGKALAQLKLQAARTDDPLLRRAVWQVAYDSGNSSLLADAPPAVQYLRDFDFEYGLRKATDASEQARQIEMRLGRDMRLAGPR